MLRQFLTILALVTGLAAWAEPAQAARIGANVESASFVEQGPSCATSRSGLVADSFGSDIQRHDARKFCPRPVVAVLVPTIQLQADRARE